MSDFTPFLAAVTSGRNLSHDEMKAAMAIIFSGGASDIEIGGFLAGLRARGETIEEIAAAAAAMRDNAVHVEAPPGAVDTCGTGGDGAGTLNISTAAALVVAGCGVPVAKHGNKAATSKSGSSEVLATLGVNLDVSPETINRSIRQAGVGYMHAALHHGAVAHAAAARKALGVRTMFNLLGPLSNPAGAKRQVLGVFAQDLIEPVAGVLKRLGAEAAWVVAGEDGLDELTITGRTHVAELKDGGIRTFAVTPEDAGLSRATLDDIRGGAPVENAAAIMRLLDGEKGAYRDIVVLNAAAALVVADAASELKSGAEKAAAAIDTGAAKSALQKLVDITNAP